MLNERVSASTAAVRVGYASASQFSREFKRFFGVPPSQADGAALDLSGCLSSPSRIPVCSGYPRGEKFLSNGQQGATYATSSGRS